MRLFMEKTNTGRVEGPFAGCNSLTFGLALQKGHQVPQFTTFSSPLLTPLNPHRLRLCKGRRSHALPSLFSAGCAVPILPVRILPHNPKAVSLSLLLHFLPPTPFLPSSVECFSEPKSCYFKIYSSLCMMVPGIAWIFRFKSIESTDKYPIYLPGQVHCY